VADRESALVALSTLLGAIPIVGGVSRQFEAVDEIPATALPYIIIEDDGAETITMKTGDFADVEIDVSVIGYVQSALSLSTSLNELDVAIKTAVAGDRTLGGIVQHVSIEPTQERSGTQFKPYGWFIRPLKIMYEGRYSLGL